MTRDQRLIALFAAVAMITGGTLGASVIVAGPPPVPVVVSRDVPVGPDGRLSLRIFGDTMLGGEFPLLAAQRGQSYDWAFDALRPSLTEADYAVAVAEAPFTDLTEPWDSSRAISFFTSTPPVAGALSRAGVDALMLATDHSFDTGPDGLADTMVHAEAAGIATIGGGPDLPRAEQPLLLRTELGTAAVVGFGESFGHRARNDTAGTMVMSPEAVQRRAMRVTRGQSSVALFAAFSVVALATVGGAVALIPTAEAPVVVSRDVAPRPDGGLSVQFVGDTLLGDAAQPLIDQWGHDWPLQSAREALTGDFVVTVAEAPISATTEPWNVNKRYSYSTQPEAAGALFRAGIDAVTLANNHTFDVGPKGLLDTIDNAEAAGIGTFGAGPDLARAEQPLLLRTTLGTIGIVGMGKDYGYRRATTTRAPW